MSDQRAKQAILARLSAESRNLKDSLTLRNVCLGALIWVGVFLASAVVAKMLFGPDDNMRLVLFVLDAFGDWPVLVLSLAAVVFGVVLFDSQRSFLGVWVGVAAGALLIGCALFLGGVQSGAGGALGELLWVEGGAWMGRGLNLVLGLTFLSTAVYAIGQGFGLLAGPKPERASRVPRNDGQADRPSDRSRQYRDPSEDIDTSPIRPLSSSPSSASTAISANRAARPVAETQAARHSAGSASLLAPLNLADVELQPARPTTQRSGTRSNATVKGAAGLGLAASGATLEPAARKARSASDDSLESAAESARGDLVAEDLTARGEVAQAELEAELELELEAREAVAAGATKVLPEVLEETDEEELGEDEEWVYEDEDEDEEADDEGEEEDDSEAAEYEEFDEDEEGDEDDDEEGDEQTSAELEDDEWEYEDDEEEEDEDEDEEEDDEDAEVEDDDTDSDVDDDGEWVYDSADKQEPLATEVEVAKSSKGKPKQSAAKQPIEAPQAGLFDAEDCLVPAPATGKGKSIQPVAEAPPKAAPQAAAKSTPKAAPKAATKAAAKAATKAAPKTAPKAASQSEKTVEPVKQTSRRKSQKAAKIAVPDDPEELLVAAGRLFLSEQRVAVSMLQKTYGLDFKRSTAILDELQERGLIGPFIGGHSRAILMTENEWLAQRS